MTLAQAKTIVKALNFYIRTDPELMGDYQLLSKTTNQEFFIGEDLEDLVSTALAIRSNLRSDHHSVSTALTTALSLRGEK
jgi:hypothetical protein